MKKSIFLGIFALLFLSLNVASAQSKWADLVAKIPELSLPYEFNYENYVKQAVQINKKDLVKHFNAKIGLSDMWIGKAVGKITASNGCVGIIWAKEDYPNTTILYMISYFNPKGKEKKLEPILYHDGVNPRNSFTIKKEDSYYVFEELYKKSSGEVMRKMPKFRSNSANWGK